MQHLFVPQRKLPYEPRRTAQLRSLVHLLHVVDIGRVADADVFGDAEGKDRVFLVEERGGVVEVVEVERLGVGAVDDDCPLGRSVELCEKFDDSGLAAAVLSDDDDE